MCARAHIMIHGASDGGVLDADAWSGDVDARKGHAGAGVRH